MLTLPADIWHLICEELSNREVRRFGVSLSLSFGRIILVGTMFRTC